MEKLDGLQSANTGRLAGKTGAAPVDGAFGAGSAFFGKWSMGVTARGPGSDVPRQPNFDKAFAAYTGSSALRKAKFRSTRLRARGGLEKQRLVYSYLVLDSDWNIRRIGDRLANVLNEAETPIVGCNFWEQYPEMRGSDFEAECWRAMSTGQAASVDFVFRDHIECCRAHIIPTGDLLAISLYDISDERGNLEELRLLRAAVEQSDDAIMITGAEVDGPDGPRILYANAAFARMTGYSDDEILGETPRINQGEMTDPKTTHKIGAALRAGVGVHARILNYRKDGSTYWKSVGISPVRDETGRLTNWIGIGRDLTESIEAENALRQSEERFRLLARGTSDAAFDWDLKANQIWCDEGIHGLLGFCPASGKEGPEDSTLEGLRPECTRGFCPISPKQALVSLARQVHPDDVDRVSRDFQKFMVGHADILSTELRFVRIDGRAIKVVARFFMIRDAVGTPRRILASIVDISEKDALEERLRRAKRLAAIGELTGGIAHDFNNLLSIIMGNLEFLIESTQPGDRLNRLADAAMSAAERSADLTSRLLVFSRRQALNPVVADLNDWLRELSKVGRRVIAEDIEIDLNLKAYPCLVKIDSTQFDTSIINLIINASHAMPDGGRLTLATEHRTISEAEAHKNGELTAGKYVIVTVSDTGTGISPKVIDRIFEPFFTTSSDGTGLGLSMVYGFVKQSGGQVFVKSEPGSGTSFSLYFLAHAGAPSAPAVAPPSDGEETGGNGELVLVVEDDDSVRKNVVAMLESLGYRTLAAANGQEALDILSRIENVDALFTDIIMPGGMNGQELAARAKDLRPGLKVLFTSGYTLKSLDSEGRLDARIEILLKPYPRRELALKIRTLLATDAT